MYVASPTSTLSGSTVVHFFFLILALPHTGSGDVARFRFNFALVEEGCSACFSSVAFGCASDELCVVVLCSGSRVTSDEQALRFSTRRQMSYVGSTASPALGLRGAGARIHEGTGPGVS